MATHNPIAINEIYTHTPSTISTLFDPLMAVYNKNIIFYVRKFIMDTHLFAC